MFRFLLMFALLTPTVAVAQAPASPTPAPSPPPQAASARRQDELRRTIEKRKAVREKQAVQRQQRTAGDAARARAEAKDAAAQQAGQTLLMIEAQRAQAEQRRAAAAEQDARVNGARLRLESQVFGQPQLFVPGQGFVPYQYGVAPTLSPVRILPVPGAYPLPAADATASAAAAIVNP